MTYVPIDKRSKKEQRAYHLRNRQSNGFNTGVRTFKTAKNPSRMENKKDLENLKKEFDI